MNTKAPENAISQSSAPRNDSVARRGPVATVAALASEASGQRGHSNVRAHSASEDARERADDTRPEPGSSARAALAPGSVIAVSSTAKPDTVKALDQRARAQGVDVLDAPICRGRFAADAGTLLALVGGRPEVVERGRAVYRAFCSDYAHLGEVGHGQVGKTMNNLLLWISAVGLIEAGRLAETTGIDLVRLRDALMMSSGNSDALKDWDMISFTWALKDMQVVAEMTDKAGLSLPITGAVKELVKEARRIKASNPPNWTGKGPTKYG